MARMSFFDIPGVFLEASIDEGETWGALPTDEGLDTPWVDPNGDTWHIEWHQDPEPGSPKFAISCGTDGIGTGYLKFGPTLPHKGMWLRCVLPGAYKANAVEFYLAIFTMLQPSAVPAPVSEFPDAYTATFGDEAAVAGPSASLWIDAEGDAETDNTRGWVSGTPAALVQLTTNAQIESGYSPGVAVTGAQISESTAVSMTLGFYEIFVDVLENETGFNCECEDPEPAKTLAALRRDILIRSGFAAIANNPPPGTKELVDAFLRDAQNFLYLRYPALRTRRFFRWTMEEGVRYYGIRSNDDGGFRIAVTISGADPAVVSWPNPAPANGRKVSFVAEDGGTLPQGIEAGTEYFVINRTNTTSQLSLTPGGTAIATTTASQGTVRASGSAPAGCVFNMQPYADIEGAWLVDLNGSWLPMTFGIPPTFYTTVSQPGLPVRLEIRQCIEVFPAPAAAYQLYIKGHFGLRPFELDSDKPTIDGHLVYLWALANALDYYGKPSAAGIATQAQDYLGQLVAGTHTGKRYVPGMRPLPPAIIPIFAPWPGGDP